MWRYRYSDELYHHGILGQKWGVRRFQNEDGTRTAEGKRRERLADSLYKKATKMEPAITKDVAEAITNNDGKLYGLDHKLKTKHSIKRKIYADSIEKGIDMDESAKGLKDLVRYTSVANDDNFVRSYVGTKRALNKKGYEEVRCRNYFDMYDKGLVKHKSVSSVYADPSGYLFEIQFQTPSSQKAKDLKTPLYERRRTPGISDAEKHSLEVKMDELARQVPTPNGIDQIKSHG